MFPIVDTLPYFDQTISQVSTTSSTWVRMVKANPNRGILVVTSSPVSPVYMNPASNPQLVPPLIYIPANTTEVIYYSRYGPMPTWEWWCIQPTAGSGQAFTVAEVTWNPEMGVVSLYDD